MQPAVREEPSLPAVRRSIAFELVLVVLVSFATFVPGVTKYSLVDPWETHYGEVARTMLQDNDFVHTEWRGTYVGGMSDNEGFRSKPVLMFWLMAAGFELTGVATDGGYSGEMTETGTVMLAIRLPFIVCAVCGLVLVWWMLARLVSRRLAWLTLLVVGTTPMFCLIARNAIPDMPLVACTMGAIALFVMAAEDGERPFSRIATFWRGRITIDARHVTFALVGAVVLLQAGYYLVYFATTQNLGVRGIAFPPAVWLPLLMLVVLAALSHDGWLLVRLPFVLVGGIIAAIKNDPLPYRRPGQSMWRHVFDDILGTWDRRGADRYLVRAVVFPIVWASGGDWAATDTVAHRIVRIEPITTMRQLYLLGCYTLLGVSILAKGPPGITVVGLVCTLYVVLFARWRALYDGAFELKRALITIVVVAIPWHVAMYLKDGKGFINEYVYQHILNRAASGVDNSEGTFARLAGGVGGYTSIMGHGMYLWAALLPAALAVAFARSDRTTREGRVRFVMVLWAITAVALFCLVETKFNHYFLPAIPPLAIVVAFFLDDIVAGRERLHPVMAALGAGIVLLLTRDLMFEPERWIEMFVFRYDRPWPSAEPYRIDTSDAFLGLGLAGVVALVIASTRYRRLGVAALGAVGFAICVWALQVYMPIAGTHWGMRDASRIYYQQRTIYGEKRVYFGAGQCVDRLAHAGPNWSFETMIPDTLYIGQPMTVTVQLNKPSDFRTSVRQLVMQGAATSIGENSVTITVTPDEQAKLKGFVDECRKEVTAYAALLKSYKASSAEDKKAGKVRPPEPLRGRRMVRFLDADVLIAYQLYWRGENFWSGGEIWGPLLEQRTAFPNPDNKEFNKYINDPTRARPGRRYFMLTDTGRASAAKGILPSQRAKDTYQVLDMTSNKFAISAFYL